MLRKIAVEEHFALPGSLGAATRHASPYWAELGGKLTDFDERRLAAMDRAGIELAVLSLNAPGVQHLLRAEEAVDLARRANDRLAEEIAKRPTRFAGLAALPMQDSEAAARELDRCVRDLGLKGALVNGYTQAEGGALYYDLPQYLPFWAEVARLGVPFYLHPRDALPARDAAYEGHRWLIGSPWSFAEETALHALRLMGSGLFDRHPSLQIVLGHLGERIPYDLWRLDHRLAHIPGLPFKRTMTEYFRSNFHIATSGHFSTPSLMQAILTVGADRILFAVDYPFEQNEQAAAWFDHAGLSEPDRVNIGRRNAVALFKLDSLGA